MTLTANADTADTANKRVTVSGVAAGNNTRHPAPVTLTIQDDDGGEIVLSARTLAVTEGEEVSYTVCLSQAPTGRARALVSGVTYGSLRMTGTSGGPYYSGGDVHVHDEQLEHGADDLCRGAGRQQLGG